MNIGIDFGSTYSTFASYDASTDSVNILTLEEGRAASIPSLMCFSRRGEYTYGHTAKDVLGSRNQRTFEAFKMLLVEDDQEVVRARGYDDTHTPISISKKFLYSVIDKIEQRHGQVDDIVVCVPEIWGTKIGKTLDGRGVLRDILTANADGAERQRRVRVVTEPEAASAFFAYNYEQKTKQAFNGHLLLIDYGGGTLDLTLTKVVSDGKGAMEISYRASGGAGENHMDDRGNSSIGNAGIAFMQDVVIRAMRDQGYLKPEQVVDCTDSQFLKAVKEFESKLMSNSSEIKKTFSRLGTYSEANKLLDNEPREFTWLDYESDGLLITYQHILKSYLDVVEGVLKREIDLINERVKAEIGMDPCDPRAGTINNFKIALVGGFGSFFLVQHQIAEIYNIDPNAEQDLRQKNIDGDKKETAIALGAALIASNRVILKRIARYSIGIVATRANGERVPYYGIHLHQDVESGKIYPICIEGSTTPVVYGNICGNIKSFVINFTGLPGRGVPMRLKEEMYQALTYGLDSEGLWTCGFSMDESNIITFHATPYICSENDNRRSAEIPLANFTNLFQATATTEEDFI